MNCDRYSRTVLGPRHISVGAECEGSPAASKPVAENVRLKVQIQRNGAAKKGAHVVNRPHSHSRHSLGGMRDCLQIEPDVRGVI